MPVFTAVRRKNKKGFVTTETFSAHRCAMRICRCQVPIKSKNRLYNKIQCIPRTEPERHDLRLSLASITAGPPRPPSKSSPPRPWGSRPPRRCGGSSRSSGQTYHSGRLYGQFPTRTQAETNKMFHTARSVIVHSCLWRSGPPPICKFFLDVFLPYLQRRIFWAFFF